MKISAHWKLLVRYTWSVRFIALAGFFSGLDVVLPLFAESMPRGIFATLSMFSAVCGGVARVVDQPEMERRKTPRASSAGSIDDA